MPQRRNGVARDVERLLPALPDAAQDHVLDQFGVGTAALDQRVEQRGRQVDRMPGGEPAALAAARGAQRRDDIGFRHRTSAVGVRLGLYRDQAR
jgi:hypothetical protein